MDTNQAAIFLLGSIGYGLAFLVWLGVAIVANHLISKYWKPVNWVKFEYHPVYFDAKDGAPLVKTPSKESKDVK